MNQNVMVINGKIDSNKVIVKDVNTSLISLARSSRLKTNKKSVAWCDSLHQKDFIDIFRKFYSNRKNIYILVLKKDFIYLFFKERRRQGERERNISVWLPLTFPTTGDLTQNPGMCPDWELNWLPFGLQASTQSLSHILQSYILFKCQ